MIKRVDAKNHFISWFNPENGDYIRTGILDVNGKDTGVDPFMGEFPSLLDIGIMGHCTHGKSGLCQKAGIECYQSGLKIHKPNMKFEDFKSLVDQCTGKMNQFALGGRGDPNKHENFQEICEYCSDNGIVPNYTTSGLLLSRKEIQVTAELCGAVAVSWYRAQHTTNAIDAFLKAGCTTNIHYVLGNNTIDEAIKRLQNDDFPSGINAVIFLLHKPVGLGSQANVLKQNDKRLKAFFQLIEKEHQFKIGFDSCTVPGIINNTTKIDMNSVDTCEGGRFSCYCTSDMKLLPCSFDQSLKWAVDLRENTIQEAWDSEQFESFRSSLRNSCKGCSVRENCMGGCPIKREVVLCDRDGKDLR